MNVLYLESSRSWGGQEYRTCLEINWLNGHGHQAWLMCDPKSEIVPKARELGTRLVALSMRRRLDLICSWRIWRFCRRNKIDLIKTYSSKDHWLSLPLFLGGIPVSRARCITDPLGNRSRAFIFKHGCSNILVDAGVIKKQLVEQNGISPDKIEVIGSAVDLAKFQPGGNGMKFRQEMGFSQDTPIIVNIGMIRSDKGQKRLAKAAVIVLKERPDARFIIVGQGTGNRLRERELREAIQNSGLQEKILMLGYRWDTPDILAAADMVVIASFCTEASPIVLREAFASGRAVVATTIGDIPEIIRDGENGLLVEPKNVEAMAESILRLLNDQSLSSRCATNALRYARAHFGFDQMMHAKVDVDLALIRQPKSAGQSDVDRVDELTKPSEVAPMRR